MPVARGIGVLVAAAFAQVPSTSRLDMLRDLLYFSAPPL